VLEGGELEPLLLAHEGNDRLVLVKSQLVV